MPYLKSVFFTIIVQGIITAACEDPLKLKAQSGQNVLLKCLGPTHSTIEAVKCIKPDLRLDQYVYFYPEEQPVKLYQHENFVGRVELSDRQMKDGNFSLILKNVTISDIGRYKCEIFFSKAERVKQVYSKLFCSIDLDEDPLKLKAQSGQNVLLKCLNPTHFPIKAMKWIKPDLRSDHYVYFYRDTGPVKLYQHDDFVDRVELSDSQMKDGDFSLILKNVTINDTGRYESEISFNKSENVKQAYSKLFCFIDLKVDEDPLKLKAQSGQNVLLKCLNPTHFPIKAMKWIKPDLRSDHYVYFYPEKQPVELYQLEDFVGRVELSDRQMKDGDFSLILKNVTINDTGRYECEISFSKAERVKQAPSELYCSIDLKVDEDAEKSGFTRLLQLENHLIVILSIVTVVILRISLN